jgi:hypothetical protein
MRLTPPPPPHTHSLSLSLFLLIHPLSIEVGLLALQNLSLLTPENTLHFLKDFAARLMIHQVLWLLPQMDCLLPMSMSLARTKKHHHRPMHHRLIQQKRRKKKNPKPNLKKIGLVVSSKSRYLSRAQGLLLMTTHQYQVNGWFHSLTFFICAVICRALKYTISSSLY